MSRLRTRFSGMLATVAMSLMVIAQGAFADPEELAGGRHVDVEGQWDAQVGVVGAVQQGGKLVEIGDLAVADDDPMSERATRRLHEAGAARLARPRERLPFLFVECLDVASLDIGN